MMPALGRCPECLLLAQSGHHAAEFQCLLLGVKRTSLRHAEMSAYDPNPTLTAAFCCSAQGCHAPANKDRSAACALRRLLSAGVLGPLLLGGFLSRLGTDGDLQHCRILTFVKMG